MRAIGVGEFGETGAVEIDAAILDEVRILSRNQSAGLEHNLPLGVVHKHDIAHQPFALGDLILHLAGDAVVQVQMLPAVAFRRPDDFLAVVHIVTITTAAREALA